MFCRNLSDADSLIPIWAGCQSFHSDKTLPIWQAEFLHYLPYSAIKYDTVFTALYIVANVASQLQQHWLPVFCDERV